MKFNLHFCIKFAIVRTADRSAGFATERSVLRKEVASLCFKKCTKHTKKLFQIRLPHHGIPDAQ